MNTIARTHGALSAAAVLTLASGTVPVTAKAEPVQVGFLWHMHQPIYVPYQSPTQVDAGGFFSFSVTDVHNGRLGPYTSWPRDAVNIGSSQPNLGAQVSFSGSLIENLDNLWAAGVNGGQWTNWDFNYKAAQSQLTVEGNRRLEMVAFGYHHPLMPLLDERDIRMQIKLHKHVYGQTWQTGYSKGMFPPETAFSTRIIPALEAEGIDWVLVDNIHFDRACLNYPHNNAASMFAPNRADQINPDPAATGGAWVQLNNLWAPTRVSAPFGYRPANVQHVDPETGAVSSIVAVPAARYEGNEDGRGGYGAFLYDQVMDALLPYNTDPTRPLFVMLHHDGDNFGGGSESYYHSNFQNMVNWVSSDPDYNVSTVEDYLDNYPVPQGSLIHVEDGSWAGADGGDPEFVKWLGGDVTAGGVSPDIHSWAVLTAAKNAVFTADNIAPYASLQNIMTSAGSNTEKAWHFLLVSQASDYWYWDGTEVWDSNVTRGSNQALAFASNVVGADTEPPTVFAPQREPYNPGGYEWDLNVRQPSDFEVWTLVDDVSGVADVTLHYRIDDDGFNPLSDNTNEVYAGGTWNSVPMTSAVVPTPPGVLQPTRKALRYGAMVAGYEDVLIDYYVEATDSNGNVQRSGIRHVYVGLTSDGPGGGSPNVTVAPEPVQAGQSVTITYDPTGGVLASAPQVYIHYGFDGWNTVLPDAPMVDNAGVWEIAIPVSASANQLNFVFNDGASTWDNNGGADWNYAVEGATAAAFEMDGQLDANATLVATNNGWNLWAAWDGTEVYLATEAPGSSGADRFIFFSDDDGPGFPAPWAKSGAVQFNRAFLAAEESNGFHAWFDAVNARSARGAVLEGAINLVDEIGSPVDWIYLAATSYESGDGGAMIPSMQVPASTDGNGSIDRSEYFFLALSDIDVRPAPSCVADLTTSNTNPGDADYGQPDGLADGADLSYYVENWLAGNTAVADVNSTNTNPGDASYGQPDGNVDGADLSFYVENWLAGCP